MNTRFIEARGGGLWGKFAIGVWDEGEWGYRSALPGLFAGALLDLCGWTRRHVWVLDLETGNGALLQAGLGLADYDLRKRALGRVCPLYRPFCVWLYEALRTQPVAALPALVELDPASLRAGADGGRG